MLCGNAIAGISVSLDYILIDLRCVIYSAPIGRVTHESFINLIGCCSEIGNSIEMLPVTSHPETYRPLMAEALRRALMPTINKMRCVSSRSSHTFLLILRPLSFSPVSMTGIVTIPGMMMRATLDGTDVEQAVRLQMIIMFMISASNALSCLVATHLALIVCIDSERRIRLDRIDARPHWLCRAFNGAIEAVVGIAGRTGIFAISYIKQLVQQWRVSNGGRTYPVSERTHLLT
jgi:hypothetical protein